MQIKAACQRIVSAFLLLYSRAHQNRMTLI